MIFCGVDVVFLVFVGNLGDLNEDEKVELFRRIFFLLFYLLRLLFYDNYLKIRIFVCLRFMSDIIFGVFFIFNFFLDYFLIW